MGWLRKSQYVSSSLSRNPRNSIENLHVTHCDSELIGVPLFIRKGTAISFYSALPKVFQSVVLAPPRPYCLGFERSGGEKSCLRDRDLRIHLALFSREALDGYQLARFAAG